MFWFWFIVILLVIIIGFVTWKRMTCWHKDISISDTVLIKQMLDEGADINAQNIDGDTLLFRAADKNFRETAKMLIARGADVNKKNNSGYTALMMAVATQDEELVALLINAGADVKAKSKQGVPIEDVAKKIGNKRIIQMLKQRR